MRSGIYGLFRLDGAPIDALEASELGLPASADGNAALVSGMALAFDAMSPCAANRADDGHGLTLLLGDIEEVPALAARLNLAEATPPALLARAALDRFGRETPAEMTGEWSLLHWTRDHRFTLMISAARRDRVLYAVAGARVAIAPDIAPLARLPWVGASLDPTGLIFGLGREALRSRMGDRTMLAGVRYLEPGGSVVIRADRVERGRARTFTPQPRWRGTVEDATAESEYLMRGIMRERLARTARPAVLLSGGLDSSLLTWLAAEERGGAQPLQILTSVAPPESGIADEGAFADIVAHHLGLHSEHVSPPFDANTYRPPDPILTGASRPPLSSRHCLTETFQAACRAHGATLLFDGLYGEMTLTGRAPEPLGLDTLRGFWHRMRSPRDDSPQSSPTHARLAPHRRDDLPHDVRAALQDYRTPREFPPGPLWGYLSWSGKAMYQPNEFYAGAVRMALPYRDIRLLRLIAGFPKAFFRDETWDRALARRMLRGRLPDSIRLRRNGMPASPDHYARLQRQAPAARARIAAFRKAEVDDWLDLDWLDETLGRIGAKGAADVGEANEAQITTITAEFLLWWRERF